jgi:hypothetical protein
MTLATSNGMVASSKVKPTDNKGTNVDEMDISPTITTHSEGRYCMHNTISTIQERGPYTVLHTFIYQFLSLLEKPIDIDFDSHTYKQTRVGN